MQKILFGGYLVLHCCSSKRKTKYKLVAMTCFIIKPNPLLVTGWTHGMNAFPPCTVFVVHLICMSLLMLGLDGKMSCIDLSGNGTTAAKKQPL